MSERAIQSVKSNLEKESAYRKNMERYNQAIRFGFYYEAIMIDYAMIEDRLRSTLYHMGLLSSRDATTVWKNNRPAILEIVSDYKRDKEDLRLGIYTMEGKIKVIRCILLWASHTEGGYHDSKYLTVLKSQIESMDAEAFLQLLDRIEKWKGIRNEIVHAMLNKNVDSMEEKLQPLAEEGMQIARIIDNQERILKKGNKIRRKINLSMN
jgi:hypothetical protein